MFAAPYARQAAPLLAARACEYDFVSGYRNQGIGVATGLQKSFSWTSVAASAVGAGVGQAVGPVLGDSFGGRLATGLIAGTAAAVMRGGRVSVQQVAVDAFGQTLGNSFVGNMQNPGTQEGALAETASTGLKYSSTLADNWGPQYGTPDVTVPAANYSLAGSGMRLAGYTGEGIDTTGGSDGGFALDGSMGSMGSSNSASGMATVGKNQGVLAALRDAGVPMDQRVAAYGQIYASGQLTQLDRSGNLIVQPGQQLSFDLGSLTDQDRAVGGALVGDAARQAAPWSGGAGGGRGYVSSGDVNLYANNGGQGAIPAGSINASPGLLSNLSSIASAYGGGRVDLGTALSMANGQIGGVGNVVRDSLTGVANAAISLPEFAVNTLVNGLFTSPSDPGYVAFPKFSATGKTGSLQSDLTMLAPMLLGVRAGGAAAEAVASGETVTVFRVEGVGNQRLSIDAGGSVSIPQVMTNKGLGSERNLYLNFGDETRAQEFLQQRLQQFPDNTIKTFEVPKSFVDELRATAVEERMRSLYPNRPVIADPTKATNQYGLSQQQIEQLRRVIIPGSGR